MSTSRQLPDIVRDSELVTEILGDHIIHAQYVSNPARRQRQQRLDEKWARKKKLGGGSFGTVWLETCVSGPSMGSVRAVKEIIKPEGTKSGPDYGRELEAITKFSHRRVRDSLFRRGTILLILDSIATGLSSLSAGSRPTLPFSLPWSTSNPATCGNIFATLFRKLKPSG
jgi:hypothetical protein